jgi:hypothetical protein
MDLSNEEILDGIIADLSAEIELTIENLDIVMDIAEAYAKSNKRFSATVTFMEPWLTCTLNVDAQMGIIAKNGHSPVHWTQLRHYVEEMATVAIQVTQAIPRIPKMTHFVTSAYISTFRLLDIVL